MKDAKGVKLVTVGMIIKELAKLEKTHSDEELVCCLPDDSTVYVVGTEQDEDGDVCIFLEEEIVDSGFYDVEMLCDELHSYDMKARVFMKGCGLLLGLSDDGGLFAYDEEDCVVFCNSIKIGKYNEEPYRGGNGWLTEAEIRKNEEDKRRQEVIDKRETVALAILTLCLIAGLVYNVYAIVTHSGALWENILWTIVCLFTAVFCSLALYFQRKK